MQLNLRLNPSENKFEFSDLNKDNNNASISSNPT